jgi:hypothetical protein
MRPSPFGALHHVGIVVPELNPSVANLCALLQGDVVERGRDDALGADWVWIESAASPIIEVVAPAGSGGPIAAHLERRGPGLHHVSFRATDLDDAMAHVRRCGFGVVGEDRAHSGYEEFFVHPDATGRALFHAFRELDAGP